MKPLSVVKRPVPRVRYPDEGRCQAVVYVRDTYRYTGRGKGGFELHYNRQQCARKAVIAGLCRQHAAMAEDVAEGVAEEPSR